MKPVLALAIAAAAIAPAGAALAGPTTPPDSTAAGTAPPDSSVSSTGGNPAGCVDEAPGGTSLFPDQFTVTHAENYSLTYADTYKVLTVGETSPGGAGHTYVLVQCGSDAPALEGDLAGAEVVEIPVATIFSESTSHDGFIDVLGLADRVTGVANGDWVMTPSLAERVAAGEIVSFSPNFQVDTELVVASDPDVYVTGGYDDPAHETLRAAGVPVVANAEWLETSPEGWAEWVGVFAALTNTEARAAELYSGWVTDYEAAAARAADVTDRPTVITGDLFEGTWYTNGGAGIVAQLIADGGGDFVYADDPTTGALALDIETVLADGADAQVWLNPTSLTSREQAVAADSRYGEFAAWDDGGVWTNTIQVHPGITFIEQGPVMIAEYLLDYVKVLHPELAADHEFVFMSQLPDGSATTSGDTNATPATTTGTSADTGTTEG